MAFIYIPLGLFLAAYFATARTAAVDWIREMGPIGVEGESLRRHFYWQRLLHMVRLGLLAAVCFGVVSFSENPDYHLSPYFFWLIPVLVTLTDLALRFLCGKLILSAPEWFTEKAFLVRVGQWTQTPFEWLLEPWLSSPEFKMDEHNDLPTTAQDSERIFQNIVEFKTVRVRDCMTPRTEITAVNLDDSVEMLRKAFIESGHSKIVVIKETMDVVQGYCHSLALFKKPKHIESIITPILFTSESALAGELMVRFLEERKSLAVVVDEFGGTAGLVSIEDIVEQVFGEIQDEHDTTEDWLEKQIDENTYLFSGRHSVEYLNEKYGLTLPEGEYDTLAGLFLHLNETLPNLNDSVSEEPYALTIESMEGKRIDLIRLSVIR